MIYVIDIMVIVIGGIKIRFIGGINHTAFDTRILKFLDFVINIFNGLFWLCEEISDFSNSLKVGIILFAKPNDLRVIMNQIISLLVFSKLH